MLIKSFLIKYKRVTIQVGPISQLWGVALSAVAFFATGFLKKAGEDGYIWVKKKFNPNAVEKNSPHLIIQMNGDGKIISTNDMSISENQLPAPKNTNSVTLDQIRTAIDEALPLQPDSVAANYVGLRVEWETLFSSGRTYNDTIRLYLRVIDAKRYGSGVTCEVPASQYRELGILHEGAKIRVTGEIKEIDGMSISLHDAHLYIHGTQVV
jgi:hypothetical protein